jgi:hypothetical protein
MRNGDLVWRHTAQHASSMSAHYNSSYGNTTVVGMVSLNGQGDGAGILGKRRHLDQNELFLSKIDILGIADFANDENEGQLFNIHCGGTQTLTNVCNVNWRAGDWLIAYAPRLEELSEGGRGQDADNNGVITLWLKPYDVSAHKNTPVQILHCLTEVNTSESRGLELNRSSFIPEYADQCERLLESMINIGITFMKWTQKAKGGVPVDTQDYVELLRELGHRSFYATGEQNFDLKQSLVDHLFACAVPTGSDKNNCFGNSSLEKSLNHCQRQGVSLALFEQARFIKTVTKNIVGKALTSTEPGRDGLFQHRAYST